VGPSPRGRRGTIVTFWPDSSVFEETEFRATTVVERLQVMAFLNRALEIRFRDERPDHAQDVVYRYTGGIVDYARHLNALQEARFKKALTNVLNKYARAKNQLKEKDDNLLGEDIREGLTAILTVRLRD